MNYKTFEKLVEEKFSLIIKEWLSVLNMYNKWNRNPYKMNTLSTTLMKNW
jgi:hypothetical protein